ncbi:hypothetical protein [Microbacterium aquilitoris]|nr:hypothetical protein [Microbacterium sp. KSW2-22]MDT3345494.1 hypothetical protein [Microbacterium sp. KSW2-22]
MDPLTSAVLFVTLFAAGAYVLYWIIRKAVAHGIQEARQSAESQRVDAG